MKRQKEKKKKRIKTFKMCCSYIDTLVLDIWKSTNERERFFVVVVPFVKILLSRV
jgi:hypothetical protein